MERKYMGLFLKSLLSVWTPYYGSANDCNNMIPKLSIQIKKEWDGCLANFMKIGLLKRKQIIINPYNFKESCVILGEQSDINYSKIISSTFEINLLASIKFSDKITDLLIQIFENPDIDQSLIRFGSIKLTLTSHK